MIAKIHPGNNFGGLVNYANDIEKKEPRIQCSHHRQFQSTGKNPLRCEGFRWAYIAQLFS